jgi:hypothetical protein
VTDEVAKALDAAERVVAVCDVLADMTRSGFDAFAGDLRSQSAVDLDPHRVWRTVTQGFPDWAMPRAPKSRRRLPQIPDCADP